MPETLSPVLYAFTGGLAGLILFAFALIMVPKLLNWITPHHDEHAEIVKGNQAMATYFGLLTAASIIGVSIIIGAAVFAGFHV